MARLLKVDVDMASAAFDANWRLEAAMLLHRAAWLVAHIRLNAEVPLHAENGDKVGLLMVSVDPGHEWRD